ncbi:PREDICTED: neuritin-like, partial [Mesitornis unicolor]|uniref:neuritin-like n=1 Tax=Mesitornis unicolor TaxID=54374 RepID=UPI000528DD47
CTLTALTDCQEGATDLWEKLRRESKNLDFQGSLFELCGGGSGAAPSLLPPALPLLLAAPWAGCLSRGGEHTHTHTFSMCWIYRGSVHPLLWGRCAFLWLMMMMMVVVVADDGETPV